MSIWDTLGNIGKNIGNFFTTAVADSADPFSVTSFGKQYGTQDAPQQQAPAPQAAGPVYGPELPPQQDPYSLDQSNSDAAAIQRELAGLQAQLRSANLAPYQQVPEFGEAAPNYTDLGKRFTTEAEQNLNPKYNALEDNYRDSYGTEKNILATSTQHQQDLEEQLLQLEMEQNGIASGRATEDLGIRLKGLLAGKQEQEQSTAFGRLKSIRDLVGNLAGSGMVGSGFGGELGFEANQERSAAATAAKRAYDVSTAAANLESSRTVQDIQEQEKQQKAKSAGSIQSFQDTKASQQALQDERLERNLESLQSQKESEISSYVTNNLSDAQSTYNTAMSKYYAKFGLNV